MSDYSTSEFWHYVKPGEWATCDSCNVTQMVGSVVTVERDGRTLHFCKDKDACSRWKASLSGRKS